MEIEQRDKYLIQEGELNVAVEVMNELLRIQYENAKYCGENDCNPTSYMKGSNDLISDMIQFINTKGWKKN